VYLVKEGFPLQSLCNYSNWFRRRKLFVVRSMFDKQHKASYFAWCAYETRSYSEGLPEIKHITVFASTLGSSKVNGEKITLQEVSTFALYYIQCK
jgi:hypothetical protein